MVGCNSTPSDGYKTVKVIELEQVASYTYFLVKEKKAEYWVVTPSMDAKPGDTYKYRGGMLMNDFYSEELDRTFDEVLFLEAFLSLDATGTQSMDMPHGMNEAMSAQSTGSNVAQEKSDVKVEAAEGSITIAELFSDLNAYEGKKVRITGEVTKFNAAIMERNWVHLQDGTEYDGKFDLTATTTERFEVGSTVILEGEVSLDKDFGYGYSYEILLEKATEVK